METLSCVDRARRSQRTRHRPESPRAAQGPAANEEARTLDGAPTGDVAELSVKQAGLDQPRTLPKGPGSGRWGGSAGCRFLVCLSRVRVAGLLGWWGLPWPELALRPGWLGLKLVSLIVRPPQPSSQRPLSVLIQGEA
jgi:hypothetical protein